MKKSGCEKFRAVFFLSIVLTGWMVPQGFGSDVRSATLLSAKGIVTIRKAGGNWEAAKVGAVLMKGDQLKTESESFAEIAIDGGKTGTVEIDSSSLFKLATLDQNPKTGDKVTLLDLAMGRVLVHAEKLQGKSKFEVKTPTSTAGVRGTTFEVKVAEE